MTTTGSSVKIADSLQLVGTTIVDKYLVESVVGEGGFAIVYRAQHLLWKRPVAVKVFKALGDVPADQRDKLLEGFIQEGALLADLSERSAAICQARDVGMLKTPKGDEVPYMVLEWLEGASLESVIQSEKEKALAPRSIEETVRLLEPAAEALALAHTKGIAHRDVKPANVFVLGDARAEASTVKLLDFGIAKVVQDAQKMAGAFSKTSGQVTSFTPAYGAPEQFTRTHGATGPWTDVFALALVVVEMLTHKDPLEGDDFMQLAYSSSNPSARPTARARGANVSDAVEAVFAKALAVKPAERYATAGDFWNALRQSLRMEPLRGVTSPPGRDPAFAATSLAPQDHDIASARTIAADGLASLPAPASATSRAMKAIEPAAAPPPAKPRSGVFVGGVAAAVVVAGGLFFALGRGKGDAASSPSTRASAAATISSASPVSSASAAAAAACPAGMIAIEGGEFYMGSDDDLDLEKPAHHVKLARYCIDRYEVTVEQYKSCSDKGGCKRASQINEWAGITDHEKKVYDPLCNIRDPNNRSKHPINCVDWDMADQYCQAQGGRLPTEAEWEFAARGPDGRKYPWGDDVPTGGHLNACGKECVAWGKANKVDLEAMYPMDDGYANTAPVGTFPLGKSRYGVEDVVGNVWEWVADYYAAYAATPGHEMQIDPKGPSNGTERVIRGGAWNGSQPSWVRPTFRFHDTPNKRGYGIGFRCAK